MKLALILACLAAEVVLGGGSPAMAQEVSGVWNGTIGVTPVHLCLQDTGGNFVGAYYSLATGEIVTLVPRDDTGSELLSESWEESGLEPGARLDFTLQDQDHLIGTRILDGTEQDIALARLQLLESDRNDLAFTSCGSLTFSAGRLDAADTVQSVPAEWHGRAYSRRIFAPVLIDMQMETFQIPGDSDASRRINAALAEGFPYIDAEFDILECSRSNLAWSGRDGLYDQRRWLEVLTDRLLVVGGKNDIYCGGPYPETSTEWQAFDRETGEAIDTTDWIAEDAFWHLADGGPEGSFADVFFAYYDFEEAGADCLEAMTLDSDWVLRPSSRGMVFTQVLPHAFQACAIDTVIPYDRLGPFLTPQGKVVVEDALKTFSIP